MSTLERQHDHNYNEQNSGGGPTGSGSSGAAALEQNARQFLEEGYDAITRALSDNSEQFLRASQQSGGQ